MKADDERLAAALRTNLKRRKAQGRVPQPSFGSDEEGDVVVPLDGHEHPGAWADDATTS